MAQADVRLRCYTAQWWGMAIVALATLAVFTIGFPLSVLVLLYTNRHKLKPEGQRDMRLGFLYHHFRVVPNGLAPYWQVRCTACYTSVHRPVGRDAPTSIRSSSCVAGGRTRSQACHCGDRQLRASGVIGTGGRGARVFCCPHVDGTHHAPLHTCQWNDGLVSRHSSCLPSCSARGLMLATPQSARSGCEA